MKLALAFATLLLAPLSALTAADPAPAPAAVELITVPVDSPAFVFSPGNWVGDEGRGGKLFRQTWNAGAYFRIKWDTKASTPVARLLLDTSGYSGTFKPPRLACQIDGVWVSNVNCADEIPVIGLTGAGRHELVVYLQASEQKERWGSEGKSPLNVLRVTGLQLDAESHPVTSHPKSKWALIIGDSITEGIGASELAGYSHLLGQALATQGYEYGLSACGWSGWINRGDNPPGDVPGYYDVRAASGGYSYEDSSSRWNKIDGNGHSLLDTRGHISGYGGTGQEPALIFINYGTNDSIHNADHGQTVASINQCLSALRASAPETEIAVMIPFGQYYASELKEAVESRKRKKPSDEKIAVIDLDPNVAKNLAARNSLFGGLHPNDRGDANIAAQIIPQLLNLLPYTAP